MTPKRLVSIWAREVSEACVLDRADIAIARIVNENIQPSEGFASRLDGIVCCLLINDVECDSANLIAVAFRQIGKLRGIAGRGDKFVAIVEHRLGERAA